MNMEKIGGLPPEENLNEGEGKKSDLPMMTFEEISESDLVAGKAIEMLSANGRTNISFEIQGVDDRGETLVLRGKVNDMPRAYSYDKASGEIFEAPRETRM